MAFGLRARAQTGGCRARSPRETSAALSKTPPDGAKTETGRNCRAQFPVPKVTASPTPTMHLPVPNIHPKAAAEPPAMVRAATRADVLWDRPIFKAPPLDTRPSTLNPAALAEELRRIGLGAR